MVSVSFWILIPSLILNIGLLLFIFIKKKEKKIEQKNLNGDIRIFINTLELDIRKFKNSHKLGV